MLDPDPDEMNADPQPWYSQDKIPEILESFKTPPLIQYLKLLISKVAHAGFKHIKI
jgi:hypothetical protein